MSCFSTVYADDIASIMQMCTINTPLLTYIKCETPSRKRKGGISKSSCPPIKPKPTSWTYKFVCLASTDDNRVPTTLSSKELLIFDG